MRRMRKPLLLSLAALLVPLMLSCAAPSDRESDTEPPTDPAAVSTAAPTTLPEPTDPPAPVVVYPGALEDYLLPLEEYSWERTAEAEFVMLHFTSAVVPHPEDPFNMDHIRDIFVQYDLSVHYIIERDGTVRCYIPEDRVAWHAGVGHWTSNPKYTNDMNPYAIGIEIVAIGSEADMAAYLTPEQYAALDDGLKGFTQAQYEALELLVADICTRNGIPMDRRHVIGHQEYNPEKNDPGELFDWSRLFPDQP